MPNIASVTEYLPFVAEDTVTMSLSGSISPGAATVGVNGMTNYSNGDVVVFTIDGPTPTLKQVFTGTVAGANVVNCVWTYGTNQPHSLGAPIIDYVSATTIDMISAAIGKQHTGTGTHQGVTNTGGMTTDTLTVTGATTFDTMPTFSGGFNNIQDYNPYKTWAYLSANVSMTSSPQKIPLNTTYYDTSSNFSAGENAWVCPKTAFYLVDALVYISTNAGSGTYIAGNVTQSGSVSFAWPLSGQVSTFSSSFVNIQNGSFVIPCTVGDTLSLYGNANVGSTFNSGISACYLNVCLYSAT